MDRLDSPARRWTLAILAHRGLVLVGYLFVELRDVPRFVMPSPQATLDALLNVNRRRGRNAAVTATEIVGGDLLAPVMGCVRCAARAGRCSRRSRCQARCRVSSRA